VTLGDPRTLEVGEWVVGDARRSASRYRDRGIVSARAAACPDDTYVPFIQTDVAVNPATRAGRYSTCV